MRVIRVRATAEKFGVTERTINRWCADPSTGFPKKIQLGPNSVGFLESEIDGWIERNRELGDREYARWLAANPTAR